MKMSKLESLEFNIGPRLEAQGGILDRLDYRQLRRLGVQLRNIPSPGDAWDIPPAVLEGWVNSYKATIDSVRISDSSGLMSVLREASDEIRQALSIKMLPALDAQIADRKKLGELIRRAKETDRFKAFVFDRFEKSTPSQDEVAKALVVVFGASWAQRPKVNRKTGLRRLQIGALIGKAAIGGALVVANLSIGVLGGLSVVPGMALATVPLVSGLVSSTYIGLSSAFDAIEKIAKTLQDTN